MNRSSERVARFLPVASVLAMAAGPVAQGIVYRNDMTDVLSRGLASQSQFRATGKVNATGGTGTLIAPDWVLTAKHVTGGDASGTASASFAVNGMTYMGKVYANPSNDLSLIRLSTSVSGVTPIAPGFFGGEAGKLVWLVGYGRYGTVANQANTQYDGLLRAGTNVVREYQNPYVFFDNANTNATSSVYESSTGPGDSGGPMYQQINNTWYVVGETFGAGAQGFIHTPTNPSKDFILNTIRTVSGNASFAFATPTGPVALTWDADATVNGASDGAGVWDTQRSNFRSATSGFNHQYDNAMANDVTFGSSPGTAAGTVTIAATNVASGTKIDDIAGPTYVASGVNAHSLTFGSAVAGKYTIAASGSAALTLVHNGLTNPSINTASSAEISAAIAAAAVTITKLGNATLTLSGTNTYSGTMAVSAGTLAAKSAAALPGYATTGRLSVASGATLALNVGGLAEWTPAQIDAVLATPALANGSTIALDTTNGNFTHTGVIGGSVGFVKSGVNTLSIAVPQTYTGVTTINAGTLALAGAGRLPNTAVTVGSGATLLVRGGVTQSVGNLLVTNAIASATATVSGPGTLNISGTQLGGGTGSTLDLTGLAGFTADHPGGVSANGNSAAVKLPAGSSLPYGLSVGTGDYATITNTTTTVTLGGDTSIGNIQVGNYHANGVLNVGSTAVGTTLKLRGPSESRVNVLVGVNSAGTQNQSGVFNATGMVLDALVGTMRIGDYRPGSGTATATGTFTMNAGNLDAQSITLAYSAPTGTYGLGGVTNGTFNQFGGTVTVDSLLLGHVGNATSSSATQTATYNLGTDTTPATLSAREISTGAINDNRDTIATRIFNFVNGRITPTANASLSVNYANHNPNSYTSSLGLKIVLAANGTHALTAPAGKGIAISASAQITGSGGLTIDGAGTVSLNSFNTYTGGTRVTNGSVYVYPSARFPFVNGDGVNIEGGELLFIYVGAANNPAATIRSLLAKSHADNGFANNETIRSTNATAARGLGYFDYGFNTVRVVPALYGDADLDGGVSINDFSNVLTNFGVSGAAAWVDGDFDYDGNVSINDFNLLAANFGQSLTGPAAGIDYAGLLAFAAAHDDLVEFERVTGVPEPAVAAGLLAFPVLLPRRRKAC